MSDDECGQKPVQETQPVRDGGPSLASRVFAALGHQQRRYVLYYLRDHEHADLDKLATQLAAWTQDTPQSEVSANAVDSVKTELIHTHLPKLENYGFVDYDRRSEKVSYTHPPGLLDDALELCETLETPSDES